MEEKVRIVLNTDYHDEVNIFDFEVKETDRKGNNIFIDVKNQKEFDYWAECNGIKQGEDGLLMFDYNQLIIGYIES